MYNSKRKFFLLSFLLLWGTLMFAQQPTVSGKILDSETGESLIGASIIVKGTALGTISDLDGSYSLQTNTLSDTLEISYIGYKTLIEPIAGRSIIDVSLYVSSNELDEVVVVGYGRQKKRVISGSIASLSGDNISKTPTLRVEQVLQGRTAGVQVTNQSGQPGDEPTVRVRGIGTTGNSKPLYIVDGMAVSGIDYLNPGDIETVDVLKDAASAAIYGARAANGVVLITTKSGTKGKLSVGYDGYYGIQNVARKLDMLNADEYKMIMNEGATNAGLSAPFDLNEISRYDTDWQEALFENNAPMQSHQVSITGGNDKSSFASSLSYFTQAGIIGGEKSQFDRYTARLNSNHKVNKIFSFGNNLAYTHLVKRGIGTNQSFNGVYSSALNLDPLTPVYQDDTDILNQYPYSDEPVVEDESGRVYGISENVGAEVVNPLALLEIENAETRKDEIVGNVYGQIEPIEGLKFRSSLGIDLAYVMNDSYRPLFYLNGAQLNDDRTSVSKNIQRYFTWQLENTAIYEKEINNHNFSALVGMTASEYKFEDLSGFNAKVPVTDPDHVYLNLATDTVWTANGGASHSALFSLFSRLNYSFLDRYSLTAIVRRDGSSKFGANNRYGIFPSVGLAWVASDEPFIKDRLGKVNYLKLRASWGVNGNQEIGAYQFVSTINKGRGYTYGSGYQIGSSPLFIENSDIHWEESEQLDLGIDAGLFKNRMQVSLDYYVKNTKDLLERIAIPAHVGNSGPIANVGSVQNKGVEWAVSWKNANGIIKHRIGINGSYNVNEITHIGNTEKVINGATWALEGTVTRSEEGLPIAYFWGYKTDGIFQNQADVFSHINNDGELLQPNAAPGDVRFVDSNGDGTLNDDDRTMIGNPTPDVTLGLDASAEFKNFDLSVFFQGAFGHEIFNGTMRQDLRYTNRTTAILDRWTGEGTSNSTPRYTWSDINNNYRISDLYIENGSYVRLKNVQLGYSLPSNVLKKMGAEKWRFYLSAENLLTFTKYTGVDPEIGAFGYDDNGINRSFDIGIDRGVYPQARTYRIGTSVTF